MSKNIVEAYIEFYGQLVIVISGISGSGRAKLAANISEDFQIKMVNVTEYYKKDYDTVVKLPNGTSVVNYDDDNAIDWDKFNEYINSVKNKGIAIVCTVLPTSKIAFEVDYHVSLKISKQIAKDRITKYIQENPDKKMDLETEILRLNMLKYSYYFDGMDRMNVNRYVNASTINDSQIYDTVFDSIINMIHNKVHEGKAERTGSDTAGDQYSITEDI